MSFQFDQMWFLLIFHLIGGGAVGNFFRGLLRGKFGCNAFFLFVWGILFGGVPLLAGIDTFEKNPFLLPAQIFVFAVTIIIVALAPDILVESFTTPPLRDTIIGGFFVFIGLVLLLTTLADPTNWLFTLLMSGVFFVVGGYIIFDGVKKLVRPE